jgi:hypothetical protein
VSTPFNNQWVLGRARSRRRQRKTDSRAGATHAEGGSRAPQKSHAGLAANPRYAGHADARSGLAFMARAARKRPRWVDRDT